MTTFKLPKLVLTDISPSWKEPVDFVPFHLIDDLVSSIEKLLIGITNEIHYFM